MLDGWEAGGEVDGGFGGGDMGGDGVLSVVDGRVLFDGSGREGK
jgi:hypothetical protein